MEVDETEPETQYEESEAPVHLPIASTSTSVRVQNSKRRNDENQQRSESAAVVSNKKQRFSESKPIEV